MVRPTRTLTNAMTLARIAVMVVAFLIAHDLVMTLSPHHTEVDAQHHQHVEVEDCGPGNGIAHTFTGPPIAQSSAYCTPVQFHLALETSVSTRLEPIVVGENSSALRISLQVFLN